MNYYFCIKFGISRSSPITLVLKDNKTNMHTCPRLATQTQSALHSCTAFMCFTPTCSCPCPTQLTQASPAGVHSPSDGPQGGQGGY